MKYKAFFRLGTRLKIFFYCRIGTQFAKNIFRSIIQQAQEISALCLCLCPAQLQQNQTALFSSAFPWNPNWPGSAAVEPFEIPQNSLQGTIEMSFRQCRKQETLIGHRVSASKQCVLIFQEIPIRDMWQDPQFTHEQGQEIACSTRLKVELCCRRASWNWSWNSSRWSEMHFSQCMWQLEIFCAYFQHAAHWRQRLHSHTHIRTGELSLFRKLAEGMRWGKKQLACGRSAMLETVEHRPAAVVLNQLGACCWRT